MLFGDVNNLTNLGKRNDGMRKYNDNKVMAKKDIENSEESELSNDFCRI